MGDNQTQDPSLPEANNNSNPPITMEIFLTNLAESSLANDRTVRELSNAFTSYMNFQQAIATRQETEASRRPQGHGPKPKEPQGYDGDRQDGKLDDHIRDLDNWIKFYARRHNWQDESEKVDQAATFLTGKMARIYSLHRVKIRTYDDYVSWLRSMFRDNNEQAKLRDQWAALMQDRTTVHEYAAELIYLAARITPEKSDSEKKEHFRMGLDPALQVRLAEHPEWDDANFETFIGYADRMEQIEMAKKDVQRRTGSYEQGRVFTISAPTSAAPRRGGRKLTHGVRKPRKGTDEWQAFCKKNEACYNCGDTGHQARNCKKPVESARKTPYSGTLKKGRFPPRSGKDRT